MTETAAGRDRLPYHGPQQGPRNHAHGGAAAAVLDEAMGAAVWVAGHQVLAANLNVDFRVPVPLGVDVEVEAWVAEVTGRKARAVARMMLPGSAQPLVEATGIFVSVPAFFAPDGAAPVDPAEASWSTRAGRDE